MKICITARESGLDSDIDPRFGRCKNFVIVDTETLENETCENPNMQSTGGAGIQSGQFMSSKNIKAVLTGNVGPNAFQTLSAAGIDVITGVSGTVGSAVEKYKKGELKSVDGASVDSHFGSR